MIPRLWEKSKEGFQMDIQSELLDLDEAVERLSWGVSAVGAVCEAAELTRNHYAPGLCALWEYLHDTERTIRRKLDRCIGEERGPAGG